MTALISGSSGNDIALAETTTDLDITTAFANGLDAGMQALQFPRSALYDSSGRPVVGVPLGVKQATAEYAVRAHGEALYQDPTIDETGRAVVGKREKVGPIETETTYADGASLSSLIKPYPAADRLLTEYLTPAGGVTR